MEERQVYPSFNPVKHIHMQSQMELSAKGSPHQRAKPTAGILNIYGIKEAYPGWR
jgi:hypothetical protein